MFSFKDWLSKHCFETKRTFAFLAIAPAVWVGVCALPSTVLAQPQCTATPISVGYRDYSYAGGPVTSEPTAEKPESKLWFNDGAWWGILWEPVNDIYRIYRYDFGNQCWLESGPDVDGRGRSSQDVLWDEANNKLYVVAHPRLTIQDGESLEARLYRYSYDSNSETYSLDAGFPAIITASTKTAALTIAKDSTGKLWATWTDNFKVMVNRTDGTDTNWGTPFILPAQENDLGVDLQGRTGDISAIVAFGGSHVGILWGNQNEDVSLTDDDKKFFFSVHADGDPDSNWSAREDVTPTLSSNNPNRTVSDDHINLAVHNGIVLAALKTGLTASGLPLNIVAKRESNGTWTYGTFGTTTDGHTRPMVLYDSNVDSVFVFAKGTVAGRDALYMKSAPLSNLSFTPSGLGRKFIESHSQSDINNPTSTKQNVDAVSGILVLSSDATDDVYLHNYLAVGNIPPVAADDNAAVNGGSPTTIDVLANDTDVDGTIDATTVTVANAPLHGTTEVNPTTGEITYTSDAGFFGTDIFSYTVNDNRYVSSLPGTVVLNVNAGPTALDDSLTVPKQTVVAINVLANDSDPNGTIDASSVTVTTTPKHGLFSVNGSTGEIAYSSNPGFFGTDSLKYTVDDNAGAVSNVATVWIKVGVPTATNDSGTTNEDRPVNIDVLANDSDLDGTLDPTTVAVVAAPSNGTTAVVANGQAELSIEVSDDAYVRSDRPTSNYGDREDIWVRGDLSSSQNSYLKFNVTGLAGAVISAKIRLYVVDGSPDGGSIYSVSNNFEGSTTPWNQAELIFNNAPQISGTPWSSLGNVGDEETVEFDVTAAIVGNGVYSFGITSNSTNRAKYGSRESANPPVLVISVSDSGPDGSITYFPSLDFSGTDSFTYTVKDNDGVTSNAATVDLTVLAGNESPTAVDDTATVNEETPVVIDVLANDSDFDGTLDNTTVAIVTQPTNGTTAVDPVTGQITYTPAQDFEGNDSLTYTVADNETAVSNAATVTVTVLGVNDPPLAVNDTRATGEDTPVVIDVLSNDSDIDGTIDSTSVAVVGSPNHGTTSVDGSTGEITYTPGTDFFGVDSLSYTVADNGGAVSNPATVTINVTDANDAPVALDDSTTVLEDNPIVLDVLANDSDADGSLAPSSVTIVVSAANGSTTVDETTGEITYTPALNFSGNDSFRYTVADNLGEVSNTATARVTVTSVNDAPTASSDSASTDEEASVVIDVLANDTDVDGTIDQTTVAVVNPASNGTTSVDGTTGEVTYTPAIDFFGSDSFNYTVEDDQGTVSPSTTVTITVRGVNDLPVAADDQANTTEDLRTTIEILTNDNDPDGALNVANVTIISAPENGTISVDTDQNALEYTPNPNFFGGDTFTYTVSDNDGGVSNQATVTVSISSVNDAPLATDDSANATEDQATTIEVLSNDSDPDGSIDATTVSVVSAPVRGTATVEGGTGVVTYRPTANFSGTDSFTYTVRDDLGLVSNAATVTVSVQEVNDPPIAVNDGGTTNEDVEFEIDVLSNDVDIDGSLVPGSVSIQTPPTSGTASVDSETGRITYTPDFDFSGGDTFTYTVDDDAGGTSNIATVSITVINLNDPPIAVDDSVLTNRETPVQIQLTANDRDVDGTINPLTVAVTAASNGTIAVMGGGVVRYNPNSGFVGTDQFSYSVRDNEGELSNNAIVTVMVNDLPVAVADDAFLHEGTNVEIDVLSNDSDPDGIIDPSTVAVASGPANGTLSVEATTGVITYNPNLGFSGTDSFTYTFSDEDGGVSNAALVTVTINDLPIAVADTVLTNANTPVSVDVILNDTDSDGSIDPRTVAIGTGPSNGSLSVDADRGVITYTPNVSFFGGDSFEYRVSDEDGGVSDYARVSVRVNAFPIASDDVVSTGEDEQKVINALGNDSDPDGSIDVQSLLIVQDVVRGSTSIDVTTGRITYTPNPDFFGSDTFVYTVKDNQGATSNQGTVTIIITDINDLPTAKNDVKATDEDTAVDIDILANDSDSDGTLDASTVTIVTPASDGTVSVDPSSGMATYTPNLNFEGTDSFTYTVRDDDGDVSNEATVTVSVSGENDPPVASDDGVTATEDVSRDIRILDNDFDVDGVLDAATVTLVSPPSNGTATVNASTGVVTYSPNQDFFGSDTFTYTVRDNVGLTSNEATVTITVTAENDLPVAVDDAATTNEDASVPIDVLSNDSDLDGTLALASVQIVSPPSSGTATVDISTGEIIYTPNPNFAGTDNFTYTVDDDAGGASNEATATITITSINDPPIAVNDEVSVDRGLPIEIDVTLNDSDVDGTVNPLTVAVTAATHGTISVLSGGIVRYRPDSDFVGTDEFTYAVRDNDGAFSNDATVRVKVNDPPVAVADEAFVHEGSQVEINVVSNDSDSDGTIVPSSVAIVAGAQNGTTLLDGAPGVVTYRPNVDFAGRDSFTYTVSDENGGVSNTATVTVTVNDLPIAVPDTTITKINTLVSIAVTSNDHDADGSIDSSTLAAASNPSNGSISFDPARGVIIYFPNADFYGVDTFSYTVRDDVGGTSNAALVTVDVNAAPVAVNDAVETAEDQAKDIEVLENDNDADGELDPATLLIIGTVANGRTVLNPTTGVITYTPDPNFFGTETFRYTVKDNDGTLSNEATVTITVGAQNDLPEAVNDVAVTEEETPKEIDILSNDRDIDGTLDISSVTLVTPAENGTTTIDPGTGAVTYTPNLNFEGTDTFTYTVADNEAGVSNEATVTITVSGENDPPVAVSDLATTGEDTQVRIDVLANDRDVDGTLQPATVRLVTSPKNGTAEVNALDGAITYTPSQDFFGSDTLTYTVRDDTGLTSNAATVTVTVTDANDAPIARDDEASTDEEAAVDIAILANDDDVDGTVDSSSVAIELAPENGTTTIDRTSGVVTYSPSSNFFGADSFRYSVRDNIGLKSNTAMVKITVINTNEAPVALNDVETTGEETPVTIDILRNDSDVDGSLDISSLVIVSGVSHGSTSIDAATGQVTYTPDTDFDDADTFSYTISDDKGAVSNVATVTITVSGVNDAPVAQDDSVSTEEDLTVTIEILTNDSDTDGNLDPSSVVIVTPSSNGATSVDLITGAVTYTPSENFFGTDGFSYTVRDNGGLSSNEATVTVTVAELNDPPIAGDDDVFTGEDTAIPIDILANDSDVDGSLDISSLAIVSGVSKGNTSIDGSTGSVTYTPDTDFEGTDTFTYTISDDDGDVSNVATVTITVSGVNDAPVAQDDSVSTSEDAALTIDILANDNDGDGSLDPSSVSIVSTASNGTSSIDAATGAIRYTPNENFFGTDIFSYLVRDNLGAPSNEAAVTITVTEVNDLPIAVDDNVVTVEDTQIPIDILANDSDVDGSLDASSLVIVSGVSNGSTSIDAATGVVTYTPDLDFEGGDAFTYRISDDDGDASNVATVTIDVNTENDPPVAVNDSGTTDEDLPVEIIILSNDGDVDGSLDASSVSVVAQPVDGEVTIDLSTGVATYTPRAEFFGTDTFSYTVRDNLGAESNVATVSVTIESVIDPPVANADAVSTNEDTPVAIDVLANDVEVDGVIEPSSVSVVVPPLSGTVSANLGTGVLTYSPSTGFSGRDTFAYTVGDNLGSRSNVAVVTVHVNDSIFPSDDSFVRSSIPDKNYGDGDILRARTASSSGSEHIAYLKFTVTSVSGSVDLATLRLAVVDGSDQGGSIFLVSNNFDDNSGPWTEGALNFDNAPPIGAGATPIAVLDAVSAGDVVEVDLTSVVSGDGVYSFAIASPSDDAAEYGTKERGNPAELRVETSGSSSSGPLILSFDPASGTAGTGVTVHGSGFGSTRLVAFNGTVASEFEVVSDSELRVQVPNGASKGQIAVTNSEGTSSSGNDFTVISQPVLASFSPATGAVGAQVTIQGSNFLGVTEVSFNGTFATSIAVESNNRIRAQVPSGASTGQIVVTNAAGSATSSGSFTVVDAPTVTSFAPTSGPANTDVTISGANLAEVTGVAFNGISASNFIVVSDSEVQARVPSNASSGPISVTNAAGSTNSASNFTVNAPPTVTSFTPERGSAGDQVTIQGRNFSNTVDVVFNGVSASSFSLDSDTQLLATVPNGASTGPIRVATDFGSATSSSNFIVGLAPNVTSFFPLSGSVGDEVTIFGSGFSDATSVAFNGTTANGLTVDSDSQLRANLPAGATSGKIVVNNPAGSSESAGNFVVLVAASALTFQPTDDSFVRENKANNNYGDGDVLRIRESNSGVSQIAYLKFNVAGLTGAFGTAKLRLFVTTGGGPAGSIFSVSNDWEEETLNYNNRPSVEGLPLMSLGQVVEGQTVVFEVTNAIVGNGEYSFAIQTDSDNVVEYAPKERPNGPELVIEPSGGGSGGNAPVVTGFSPASGAGGSEVTIFGRNFLGTTDVFFNNFPASSFAVDSDTQLRAVVGSGGGNGKIGVSTPSGTGLSATDFVMLNPPIVSSFAPASGGVGSEVTLTGSNFTGATEVRLNGLLAPGFIVDSDSRLRVTIPVGATSGTLSVTNAAGTGTSGNNFDVLPSPVVSGFTPSSGTIGTEVTVSGANFTSITQVTFGGVTAPSFRVDSESELTVDVPPGASSGPISVGSAGGTGTSATSFTVEAAPAVASFSPAFGVAGTQVTISGSSFSNATDVAFNNTSAASFLIESDIQIRATAPQGVTAGPISVTNARGTGTSSTNFSVVEAPVLSSFSPTEGEAGTEVTLTGTGLGHVTGVAFNGTPASSFTVVSNSLLRVIVPSGASTGVISVSNLAGNANSSNVFTIGEVPSSTTLNPIADVYVHSGKPDRNHSHDDHVRVRNTGSSNLIAYLKFNVTGFAGAPSKATLRLFVRDESVDGGSVFLVSNDLVGNSTPWTDENLVFDNAPEISGSALSSVGSVNLGQTVEFDVTSAIDGNGVYSFAIASASDDLLIYSATGSTHPPELFLEAGGGSSPPPNQPATFIFEPSDDALVRDSSPDKNFGDGDILRARLSGSGVIHRGYMKFSVSGLSGSVVSAKVRLFAADNSQDGGSIFSVSNNFGGSGQPWNEVQLTFDNAPDIGVSPLSGVGAISDGQTVEFDVSSAITGDGVYSFALVSTSDEAAIYHSKENANPPELVIDTGSGGGSPPTRSIAGFNPTAGPVGTEVTITGTNLAGTTTVSFNGTTASSFAVDSNVQLRATVPAGASSGPISISNGEGTVSSANVFSVLVAPSITGFSPTNGPVATEVTITGVSFSGLTGISFNGTSAGTIALDSDTQVRAVVPAGAGTGRITVSNSLGSATSSQNFTVTDAPSVASFNPSAATVGTEITITGSNFSGATAVSFNNTAATTFTVDSNTRIRATVPGGAISGKIRVSNADGTGESANDFSVVSTPVISFFSPANGLPGTEVTIFGSSFVGVSHVVFNGATASSFEADSPTRLRATVPGGATTGPISVSNAQGTGVSATNFTISAASGPFTFVVAADAYVRSSRQSENFGGSADLKVRTTSSVERNVYLKFSVSGVTGNIQSAKIRLECTEGSGAGGSIFSVSNSFNGTGTPWAEDEITWDNAPEISGAPLQTVGSVSEGQIVEFDVTAAIAGDGTYSFAIRNDDTDLANYSSKEGSRSPELIIATGSSLSKQAPDSSDVEQEAIDLTEEQLPDAITLFPNYPNPFNIETSIQFALPKEGKVKLGIFNLRGQLVRTLVDEVQKPGLKKVSWDGKDHDKKVVASGVYFLRLEVGDLKLSRKITLQK